MTKHYRADPGRDARRDAAAPAGPRQAGRIKFMKPDKGFGFIEPDGGGRDIFVHISQVQGGVTLASDERVTFVVGTARDGRAQAQDVRVA